MRGNAAIKNATSILDYIFRELAISYLDRFELAHVDPSQNGHTEVGPGEGSKSLPAQIEGESRASRGFVRKRATDQDKLQLVKRERTVARVAGGKPQVETEATGATTVETRGRRPRRGGSRPALGPHLISEARVKGYEGEACQECGNFTLVRNGTCLKCDTCGATSGCS